MFFNTTDLTRWGIGLLRRLHAVEIDLNFWDLLSRVTALENHSAAGRSIDYFTIVGDQLTIHMSDHTLEGPIIVPVAKWNRRTDNHGQWLPLTLYRELDIFDFDGSLYFAIITFTSPAVFDPNATDGMGHLLYGLMLTAPGDIVPVGGTTGQYLVKASNANFDFVYATRYTVPAGGVTGDRLVKHSGANGDTLWQDNTFALLEDVLLVSPHDVDDIPSWTGTHWQNTPFSNFALSPSQVLFGSSTVTPATGTASVDPTVTNVFKVTPTGTLTIDAASAPNGAFIALVVTTSGTSSFVITFGTNFKTTGALATGTVDAKVFTVSFVSDGTNFNETSRTVAM